MKTLRDLAVMLTCLAMWTLAASANADDSRNETVEQLGELYGKMLSLNDTLLYEMGKTVKEKDKERIDAIFDRKKADYESQFPLLMDLASRVPDTTVAREAAILTLNTTYQEERLIAIQILLEHHVDSDRMDEAVTCFGFTSQCVDLCEQVLASNQNRNVQMHCLFQIANMTWRRSDEEREEAKKTLWELTKHAGDIRFHIGMRWGPNEPKMMLSDAAASLLGRISASESIKIGEKIPSFSGRDLNGDAISISDYRGNVTLIVFWATWCGPCLKMVEMERELVKRYEGMQFKIFGICGNDEIDDNVRAIAAEHGMSWKSMHNVLEDGTRLSERFGVRGWPTCILVDRNGTVVETRFPTGTTNAPKAQAEEFQSTIEKFLPEYPAASK